MAARRGHAIVTGSQHRRTLVIVMSRTYEVVTYGCQMNVHDSERLTGLLEEAGYVGAADGATAGRGRVQHLRGS